VQKRSQVPETLNKIIDDIGIPERLRADQVPELVGAHSEFQKEIRQV
jgi:hypothetical protein